jgi:hypothetical protein
MTSPMRDHVDAAGRLGLGDRLIIERAVWSVDYLVQDLPWRSRVSKRRELRQDLRTAAAEVGARTAVDGLGDLRRLAQDYLAAEYGDPTQRPHWNAAAAWLVLSTAVMMLIDHVANTAFRAGVAAGGAHPTGVLTWGGIPHLLDRGTFTYGDDGHVTRLGGAWTPWVYVVILGGAVLIGRLWRMVPYLRRHGSASVWLGVGLAGLAVAGFLVMFVFAHPTGTP